MPLAREPIKFTKLAWIYKILSMLSFRIGLHDGTDRAKCNDIEWQGLRGFHWIDWNGKNYYC